MPITEEDLDSGMDAEMNQDKQSNAAERRSSQLLDRLDENFKRDDVSEGFHEEDFTLSSSGEESLSETTNPYVGFVQKSRRGDQVSLIIENIDPNKTKTETDANKANSNSDLGKNHLSLTPNDLNHQNDSDSSSSNNDYDQESYDGSTTEAYKAWKESKKGKKETVLVFAKIEKTPSDTGEQSAKDASTIDGINEDDVGDSSKSGTRKKSSSRKKSLSKGKKKKSVGKKDKIEDLLDTLKDSTVLRLFQNYLEHNKNGNELDTETVFKFKKTDDVETNC